MNHPAIIVQDATKKTFGTILFILLLKKSDNEKLFLSIAFITIPVIRNPEITKKQPSNLSDDVSE